MTSGRKGNSFTKPSETVCKHSEHKEKSVRLRKPEPKLPPVQVLRAGEGGPEQGSVEQPCPGAHQGAQSASRKRRAGSPARHLPTRHICVWEGVGQLGVRRGRMRGSRQGCPSDGGRRVHEEEVTLPEMLSDVGGGRERPGP